MATTYYDLLGVSRDAKLTDITRAYNRHHREVTREDAAPDLKRETTLREAYETLSDPDRRERYDASLVAPDRRRRSRIRAVLIGAVGTTVAGSYLLFAKPAPEPVLQARAQQEILDEVAPAIGRVHAIDISGNSLPVGVAFAIADGVLVTPCGSLTPASQIVIDIPPRRIPARVAIVDGHMGLCQLTAQGVGARPLDLAPGAKSGDLVYAAKVNAAGHLVLAENRVKSVGFEPQRNVKIYESAAWGISGAPLLDVQGRVIGVATDDKGHHIPVPAEWVAEARDPLRNQKPVVEVVAPAEAKTPAKTLEKAHTPPPSLEEEIAKMK